MEERLKEIISLEFNDSLEIGRCQSVLQEAEDKLRKDLQMGCSLLCEMYADYLDKKVRITYKDGKHTDGYLADWHIPEKKAVDIEITIYPWVRKITLDGGMSKKVYPLWRVQRYTEIVSIELI